MYVRKEALLSSQIENIECTLDDVLQVEEELEPDAGVDAKDVAAVVNYVRAVNQGFERLNRERVSMALIRDLHGVLMPGTRDGEESAPGQFRDHQNYIGRKGTTGPGDALFVPPPVERMRMGLGNMDYYIKEHQGHAPIVRCALAHAQFETIHPFVNGNGRLGRMLIVLMLRDLNVIQEPLLYPSLFLKDNRSEYYDRLMNVRARGDWQGWIEFFAQGMRHTAEEALQTCKAIATLKAETDAQSLSKNPSRLLLILYEHPIVDAKAVMRHLNIGFDAANDALKNLQEGGWLQEITGKQRGRIYRFDRYLAILERAGEHSPGLKTQLPLAKMG
jgi:Fic family protein